VKTSLNGTGRSFRLHLCPEGAIMLRLSSRQLALAMTLVLASALTSCGDAGPIALSATTAPAFRHFAAEPSAAAERESVLVMSVTDRQTDDWDTILERRLLRVLVVPGRTSFFLAKGKGRGFELEMFREFESRVNSTLDGGTPFRVAFVPVEQSQLLDALIDGRGDVAAALLTATAERSQRVAFCAPYMQDVSEVLVSSNRAAPLSSLEDLSGVRVDVPAHSSYVESLRWLSDELVSLGLAPVRIETPGTALVSEDLLELVSAGVLDHTVCDRHLATLWADALPGLRVRDDLVLSEGGQLAWAVRPADTRLREVLSEFAGDVSKGSFTGNVLFKRYFVGVGWLRHPQDDLGARMLGEFEAPIRRYAERFGFDWRLIAAQAYQESRLDPDARSHAGAVGLMQLMAPTARDMGFDDVSDPDDNLHAGVKYMAWLRDNFFGSEDIAAAERVRFALAAYNAGVGRVRRWREQAARRGMDADRWHGSVALLAQEDVGLEPVRYVGNIEKYVVAFSLLIDIEAEEAAQRDDLSRRRGR